MGRRGNNEGSVFKRKSDDRWRAVVNSKIKRVAVKLLSNKAFGPKNQRPRRLEARVVARFLWRAWQESNLRPTA